MRVRELKVIRRALDAQHHAVKAIVILEAEQLNETKAVPVETRDRFQLIRRTRDAQFGCG